MLLSSSSSSQQHRSSSPLATAGGFVSLLPQQQPPPHDEREHERSTSLDDDFKNTEDRGSSPAGENVCWNLRETWRWYNDLPWLAGMNYLPRTAVNFIEVRTSK